MSPTGKSKIIEVYENIIKPEPDKRLYRGIKLENGIKCLLISDPTTDRSSASIDVHIGSLVDPKELSGLAHFLEHMLFLGSKKYPKENTFAKFIEDHAGSTNAYTGSENTNYHFDIANVHLKEALDIFAQFFIDPLFDPESTDRELNAVHSENNKNLQIDGWRLDQLDKSTSKQDHPYSKFGTGNLKTLKEEPEKLGLNIRDELIKFHSKYYASNLMNLCILGVQPLDELQSYVESMFANVPKKEINHIVFDKNVYGEESLRHIYYVVPVQEVHHLILTFELPDYRDHYESNPAHYVSHLIGHEGLGSLLSELKARGWCNGLYSGPKSGARGFSFFTMSLDLSEEGIDHIPEIKELCFQYLNLLRKEGIKKWIFDELSDLSKLNFTYKDKEKPISYVSSISDNLHTFKFEHALCGNYLINKYEPKLIEEVLNCLKPELMKVCVVSKKFEGSTNETEKWYGTEFRKEQISSEQINKLVNCGLNSVFKIPMKNEFIPEDFSLFKHNNITKYPTVIKKNLLSRLWFKADDKFLLPKVSARFDLRNPLISLDPKHNNMASLFIDLLCDSLNEYTYAAELAGLRYRINLNSYGIQIDINGYDNKFEILLEKIIKRLSSFKVDEKRFNVLKENYKRSLQNFQAHQPYSHAMYYMHLLLTEKGWTKEQLLDAIDDFTVSDLQNFIPRFLTDGIFIESLIFGNMSNERALNVSNIIEEGIQKTQLVKVNTLKHLLPSQLNNYRHVKLPEESDFVYIQNNKIHKTIGVEVYFQSMEESTNNNVLTELFCQIINESTYNTLRTQEQLGYIVACGVRRFNGMQGVRFIVQSDKSPDYLDQRIENFISTIEEFLSKMTEIEFERQKEALALVKLEEPKKISKQCDDYWSEISGHRYFFDREHVEVEYLKTVKKDEIISFYNDLIKINGCRRKKLTVYVNPPELNTELNAKIKATIITDVNAFKASLPLCALPKPVQVI